MTSRSVLLLTGAAVGFGAVALWLGKKQQSGGLSRAVQPEEPSEPPIYLNSATREDFLQLGLDGNNADRIIENRPYRNKLDLVSRLIVPENIYSDIHNRIAVKNPNEPVKVA
jgi:hypothetical protein